MSASDLISFLPRAARPYAVGALLLATATSCVYAISTFAADKRVTPVANTLRDHMHDQQMREQYDESLKEAIWSDLRELCRVTPGAQCDGMPKTPPNFKRGE
jgi:hypothetical protein